MRLEYHPHVQADLLEALSYYEAQAGGQVADRFEAEFRAAVTAIVAAPTRFPHYLQSDRLRRIRLASFPFLVVYRADATAVRVLLLKHERRAPGFGAERR